MPSSDLHGPHALNNSTIDSQVIGVGPGAYALGETKDSVFLISYIGRSDDDLNQRLHDHAGNYAQFKYGFLDSAEQAFYKECRLYHDFSPPDNDIHPARPKGSNYSCPVDGCSY